MYKWGLWVWLEQLSPFPFELVCRELCCYPNCPNAEVVRVKGEQRTLGGASRVDGAAVTVPV